MYFIVFLLFLALACKNIRLLLISIILFIFILKWNLYEVIASALWLNAQMNETILY